MLHEILWQANADLVAACLAHPFVAGLRDGTLPREAFRRLVAQDALYLPVYARACALAAAACEDVEAMKVFHGLLGGCFEELDLHRRRAAEMGLDLDAAEPLPATLAYNDFLLDTARTQGLAEAAAALTPCLRLYAHLGQALAGTARPGPDHPYGEWIETYASPRVEAWAADLEALLDRVAADTPSVREAYRRALRCELDLFGAALGGAAPGSP